MSIRIADEAEVQQTVTPSSARPLPPPIMVPTPFNPLIPRNPPFPSRPATHHLDPLSPPNPPPPRPDQAQMSTLWENRPPSATARWRSSLAATQRTDVTSSAQSDSTTVVEPGFDESVLRALCDLDVSVMCLGYMPHSTSPPSPIKCGVPLLLDRIKQSMISCRVGCRHHSALAFS